MNEMFEQKVEDYISNTPKGDLNEIPFVKTLLDAMYQLDQDLREDFKQDQENCDLNKAIKTMDRHHTSTMKTALASMLQVCTFELPWRQCCKFAHLNCLGVNAASLHI